MIVKAVLDRMTRMNGQAWDFFKRSLQLSNALIAASIFLFLCFDCIGRYELYIQAHAFLEFSQVSLLMGSLIPVCLEDLLGPDPRIPPGSSRR